MPTSTFAIAIVFIFFKRVSYDFLLAETGVTAVLDMNISSIVAPAKGFTTEQSASFTEEAVVLIASLSCVGGEFSLFTADPEERNDKEFDFFSVFTSFETDTFEQTETN